jgi:MFS family permease
MAIVLLAVLLNSAAYTGFGAAAAWEALRITDNAGAPALLFALASAAGLSSGPFLGAWVDRLGPRRAFFASQMLAGAGVLVYAALRQLELATSYEWLVAVAIVNGLSGTFYSPAMHGLIQAFSTHGSTTTAASRTGLAVALGFVVGYGSGGFLLETIGLAGLMVCCGVSFLCAGAVVATVHVPTFKRKEGAPAEASGVLHGIRYLLADRSLRDAAVAYALCYSVFHLVTALLAPFCKLVLHADASQFGLLRASWSGGSALGALLLTLFWGSRQLASSTRFLAVGALGALFAIFAQAPDYPSALLMIGVVGGMHSLCRAFLDGLLMQVCDRTVIGRVRSNVNSLLSAVSLTVFALSSLVPADSIRSVFAGVGILVSVSCMALFGRTSRLRAVRG